MPANVLLIGPRASGKTTVGRQLATRLGRSFIDLDDLVRDAFTERTVHEIWATHGEAGWRRQEVASLRDVLTSTDQIVALGGGVPCIEVARTLINDARAQRRVVVAYIRTPVDELTRRLREEAGDRPSLTGRGAIEEVPEIVARREPVYRATADFILDVNRQTPAELADEIVAALRASDSGSER